MCKINNSTRIHKSTQPQINKTFFTSKINKCFIQFSVFKSYDLILGLFTLYRRPYIPAASVLSSFLLFVSAITQRHGHYIKL